MNKLELLKKFLPGLLPLIVFIIADEIWGIKIGLLVAIGLGLGEFAFIYFKTKTIDKFILLDTFLLVALGGVSILLENEIFFKIKPGLIELLLCLILGFSVFSKKNLIMLMSKRYMKDLEMNDFQLQQMKRSMKILLYILLAHTALVFYSAFYMSKEAWLFISGGLFYIIFAVFMGAEFIRGKIFIKKISHEEWLPLVNEKGEIIGKALRSECHKGSGMLHPVIHLHVFNEKGELFLQKRQLNKKVQPGKWDTAVGGHVSFGDSIEQGLFREAKEELNIEGFEPQLLTRYKWETEVESELIYLFITKYNGVIQIDPVELADGKFWHYTEIRKNMGNEVFTPNFEMEFNKYLKPLFRY